VKRKVANRLFLLRAERRLTQSDVARRLGYPTKFRYWQIENELTAPTPKERKKLARVFGVEETEIFPQVAA
jgi:transcriptional regulator with XRE-family HTH domain